MDPRSQGTSALSWGWPGLTLLALRSFRNTEQVWLNIIHLNQLSGWQPDIEKRVHLHIHTPHPPTHPLQFTQEDLWHDNYKKCLSLIGNTINHPGCSLNRLTHLHTPEHHSPPWANTECRNQPHNLVILPQLRIEYIIESMGRCTQSVYFHCILNHCSPIRTKSLNCQGADIFLPDIWIFFRPAPLILVQHNEWETGRGMTRSGGLSFDVFLPYPK